MYGVKEAKKKVRIFIDMDGTLARFHTINTLEVLYEKGYFINLEPLENMVRAVKFLRAQVPSIDIYILSAQLRDSKYAFAEKNEWLDRYLPEITKDQRIFPYVGENKRKAIGTVGEKDFLLDDYTKNLLDWEGAGHGIKLLNGINHNRGVWKGSCISAGQHPQLIVNKIVEVTRGSFVSDMKPPEHNVLQKIVKIDNYRDLDR